ncbi:MAG: hypothetical protein AB7J13_14850 [Pyrinomonadaceae bacterium]
MGVYLETDKGFMFAGTARLVDPVAHDVAWAERSVEFNPALKYVLGKYVEADRANFNNQFWTLDDLRGSHRTVKNGPLNIGHKQRSIVGHYIDTELVYPVDSAAEEPMPFIEALACFYEYYFPDEYQLVQKAHDAGSLFFSMECVARSVTCSGETGCQTEYAYAGARSDSYCEHINNGLSVKQLNQPHFLGGALIIPPDKPGWKGAEIKDLSALIRSEVEDAERVYEFAKSESSHLDATQWEQVMAMVLRARQKEQIG